MATKEELFSAVLMIKDHCKLHTEYECFLECPLKKMCAECFNELPEEWPNPEEGDCEDG